MKERFHNLLSDRVVLVTGSGRGIGAATARLLARCGAWVAVNYRKDQSAAQGVVNSICEAGGEALPVQADVGVKAEAERMVAAITTALGPPDTLVLNADAGNFRPTPIAEVGSADYETRLVSEISLC